MDEPVPNSFTDENYVGHIVRITPNKNSVIPPEYAIFGRVKEMDEVYVHLSMWGIQGPCDDGSKLVLPYGMPHTTGRAQSVSALVEMVMHQETERQEDVHPDFSASMRGFSHTEISSIEVLTQ